MEIGSLIGWTAVSALRKSLRMHAGNRYDDDDDDDDEGGEDDNENGIWE